MATITVRVRLPGTPTDLVARMGSAEVARARIDADPLLSTELSRLEQYDADSGAMTYATVSQIPSSWFPRRVARAAKVLPSVHRAEHWRVLPDGSAEAGVELEIHGVPADAGGRVALTPTDDGDSEMSYTVRLAVHVPIVGGLVENVVLHRIADTIRAEAAILGA